MQAEDAIVLDNSHISKEEQMDFESMSESMEGDDDNMDDNFDDQEVDNFEDGDDDMDDEAVEGDDDEGDRVERCNDAVIKLGAELARLFPRSMEMVDGALQ